MKKSFLIMLLCLLLIVCAACGAKEDTSARIELSGDGISGTVSYSMQEMDGWGNTVEYVYSLINNWPNKKFAVAKGIPLQSILEKAGVWDSFQVVSIASGDGYTASFTREQLLAPRFYFPGLLEDSTAGQEQRPIILTLGYALDETEMSELEEEEAPRLVFGQNYITEHNSVAFVENIASITVSNQPAEKWEPCGSFPASGSIKKGDTVKLTHDSIGLVKIFYTLDGSTPDYSSAMYNPSTYQPALNAPIPIDGDVVIKAMVSGYGKADSDVVSFEFKLK